ncbi:hypothetical protein HWV62_34701 [Athelia sp. TMB]|nr:hypothetical protein HWV62_34701 [Athelia sp. TMB]
MQECDQHMIHQQQAIADGDRYYMDSRRKFDELWVDSKVFERLRVDYESARSDVDRLRKDRDTRKEEAAKATKEVDEIKRRLTEEREANESLRAQIEMMRAQKEQGVASIAQTGLPSLPHIPAQAQVPMGPSGPLFRGYFASRAAPRGVRGRGRGGLWAPAPSRPRAEWPRAEVPRNEDVPMVGVEGKSESSKRGAEAMSKAGAPDAGSRTGDSEYSDRAAKRSRTSGSVQDQASIGESAPARSTADSAPTRSIHIDGSESEDSGPPQPRRQMRIPKDNVEDEAMEDLFSDISEEYEELQSRRHADALVGPLAAALNERRAAARTEGGVRVNETAATLPKITNLQEVRVVEEYLGEVRDWPVLQIIRAYIKAAMAAKKRTKFQMELINPGGWRRPDWSRQATQGRKVTIEGGAQQQEEPRDPRVVAREAAEQEGLVVNGRLPAHWGNPGAPRLIDHPAIHIGSMLYFRRETPGLRDVDGGVPQVNVRGFLRLAPLLRAPEVPEEHRARTAVHADQLRMMAMQILSAPERYRRLIRTHGVTVAPDPSWDPVITAVPEEGARWTEAAVVHALGRAGFNETDATEVVEYTWSWIRHRIASMGNAREPQVLSERNLMVQHLLRASNELVTRAPTYIPYTWSDRHQRWIPQNGNASTNTSGSAVAAANIPEPSMAETGGSDQKPNNQTSVTAPPVTQTSSTQQVIAEPPSGGQPASEAHQSSPSHEMETEDSQAHT